MTESTERIDGEFYFGVADSLGRSWNIFRLGALLPLEAVEHAEADKAWLLTGDRIARLDTEARHHREAERQKINEAAERLAETAPGEFYEFTAERHPDYWFVYADHRHDAEGKTFMDALTKTAAALTQASTRGESA